MDANGNRIRMYAYWPGIDQPHSMRTWEGGQNGATYYYALDLPTDNVQGLFGTTGSVAARYDYSPFGEAYTSTGTVTNPLRFASREMDASTGLYYVRARWCDPFLGRFISEDPIGLAGGINNYAFALNDPVNLTDPTGLCYRHSNGREIVVEIPGWEGGEAEWDCRPWHASMLDQVMSLLGPRVNGGIERTLTGFGEQKIADLKAQASEVLAWNECVSSATNENFQTTNEVLATIPGRVSKQIASLAFGSWAAKKLGDSGLMGDAWRWYTKAAQPGLLNAGTRVWASRIGGRTVYGVGSAAFRTVQKSGAVTLSLATGIGLGSVLVGVGSCTF